MDFEVYPSVVADVLEVVLVDEVLRDIGELDFDISGVVEQSCKVVVNNFVGGEFFSFLGEHAVEENFTKVKRGGFSPGVTVINAIFTHDGDACAVRVVFFRAEFTNDWCEMPLRRSYRMSS